MLVTGLVVAEDITWLPRAIDLAEIPHLHVIDTGWNLLELDLAFFVYVLDGIHTPRAESSSTKPRSAKVPCSAG